MKGLVQKAGLGLLVSVLGLLAVEGLLRLQGVGHVVKPRVILRLLDSDVTLPYVREDLELFWSPTPGFHGSFLGKSVTINALGLRGAEVGPPGQSRIACFGDSITFGYGVGDDETYPVALARALPGVEVINGGVTGYSSFQALGLAERQLPRLRPNLATMLVGWNDGNHRPIGDAEYARRVESVARVDAQLDGIYIYRAMKNLYLRATALHGLERGKGTPKRHRVTVEEYQENLAAFVRECAATGARPAFIALPHRRRPGDPPPDPAYPQALSRAAASLGVPLLGVGRLAGDAEPNDALFIDSLHLTPEGNRVLASTLAGELAALNLP
jgi:lysophospholipase L1-like esterase